MNTSCLWVSRRTFADYWMQWIATATKPALRSRATCKMFSLWHRTLRPVSESAVGSSTPSAANDGTRSSGRQRIQLGSRLLQAIRDDWKKKKGHLLFTLILFISLRFLFYDTIRRQPLRCLSPFRKTKTTGFDCPVAQTSRGILHVIPHRPQVPPALSLRVGALEPRAQGS